MQTSSSSSRPVAMWVMTGVIMLLIQVILGGITRLTGSGLSITEWNIVTGALPPLNHAQWLEAFDKYRQTPQFRLINADFTLSDYKFIFFWEWFHRLWARLVAVVFVVGLAWLLWKKKMRKDMIRPLVILFLLGALQGAVGWIMVASGLTGDAIYVRPTRLALHFVFALGLIVYAFWFALQLMVSERHIVRASATGKGAGLRGWTILILVVLFFQLLYGALMAGNKAAAIAPTWPTINGDWVPGALFSQHPFLQDIIGNTITVHFIHRGIAYLLLLLVVIWTFKACRLPGVPKYFLTFRWLPLLLIGLQVFLGISSLLASPGIIPNRWVAFDWLAQLHQITGLLFLLTIVEMLYIVRPVSHSVTV
ncbi:COX15/CtaA family protein [Flavitalea sp. BT771]|uniref:COX15/CtaA family protein n=1 Tax=Flavitalea sp. BT771 TaxID=3063329 RepID=UPI0026E3D41F|nr:COX15/CtaA family protein [Flavitalea sp. BT771]MDO6434361.1 COX15/CtaA family protein [Flavitalea sp. BT771]MDV6223261.1 COX15/CtaA family protein [Flavitalea sp. BT771]